MRGGPGRRSWRIGAAATAALVLVVVLLLLVLRRGGAPTTPDTGGEPPRSPPDPARPAIREPDPVRAAEVSPLANTLLKPGGTASEDLRIVRGLLEFYRSSFGSFPAGEENAHFVRALAGANPRRLVLIAPDHPAIDGEGRLVDRWGTPLFFHMISREWIEVRSAGEDREFYTVDDLLDGGGRPARSPRAIEGTPGSAAGGEPRG